MTKSRGIRVPKGTRSAWVEANNGKLRCQCGCDESIPLVPAHYNRPPRFLHNHNLKLIDRATVPRRPKTSPLPGQPCECGCGQITSSPQRRFRSGHNNLGRKDSEDTRRRRTAAISGERNWNWGGRSTTFKGRQVLKQGYIYVWMEAGSHPFLAQRSRTCGYLMEHRLVMENYLRKTDPANPHLIEVNGTLYLRRESEVHHIDGVKNNNVISNLEVLTKAEHARHHMTETRARQRAAS